MRALSGWSRRSGCVAPGSVRNWKRTRDVWSRAGGQMDEHALLRELDGLLAATDAALAARYPGPAVGRWPVHTAYVPADRFDAGTAARWGEAGAAALATH